MWIFTFKQGDDVTVYRPKGLEEKYIFSDFDGVIVGSSPTGPAFTIMSNFSRGHSNVSSEFDNEVLCADGADYEVAALEVWGFSMGF